jgi:hypothetical protein
MAEIVPFQIRGKSNIVPVFFELLGHIYTVIWGFILLDNIDTGNWRILVLTSLLPNILVLVGNIYFLKESPRFLLS